MFELLQQFIDEQIPACKFQALPYDFPLHNDLEGDSYADVIAQHLAQ